MRDRSLGATIRIYFTTHAQSTGVVVAPSSAFTASDFRIYKDGSATEKTTTNGITVTSPFDSMTGSHLVEIDTSNSTGDTGFWAVGSAYRVVLSTAKTVDSKDPSGVCVGEFSLELQTANTVRWAGTAVGSANVLIDGAITSAKFATNAITAAALAEDAATEIGAATLAALGTGTWATEIPWNAAWDFEVQSECADALTAYAPATVASITTLRGADNDTLKTLSDQIDGISAGSGLTTEQENTLNAIYDFTSGISGDQINVVGPVSSGGAIELILGKDYKVASESELTIAVTDTGGALHADLTSGTLAASKSFGAGRENGEAVIAGTIYSTTYATNVLTIKVEIDADQLPDTLPLANDWTYQIHRVTSSGDKVVVLSGQLTTTMRTV